MNNVSRLLESVRYTNLVLTAIALSLIWLGMNLALPPVRAAEPTRVVITGVEIAGVGAPRLLVSIVDPSNSAVAKVEGGSLRVKVSE